MTNKTKLLITGGAGYIGTHTCVVLLEAGYQIALIDNLCNSSREALHRVENISGKKITFHKADIRDATALNRIFEAERPQAVIHFAGLKAVGEPVEKPLEYYDNNLGGTLTLLQAMRTANARQLVFSSPCTATRPAYRLPKISRYRPPTPMATPS